MHDVSLIHFLASLRHVFVLVVRLLLDHGLRIDGLDDLIFGELLRLEVLAQRSLLIVYIEILGSLVKGPLRDRQGPLCQSKGMLGQHARSFLMMFLIYYYRT